MRNKDIEVLNVVHKHRSQMLTSHKDVERAFVAFTAAVDPYNESPARHYQLLTGNAQVVKADYHYSSVFVSLPMAPTNLTLRKGYRDMYAMGYFWNTYDADSDAWEVSHEVYHVRPRGKKFLSGMMEASLVKDKETPRSSWWPYKGEL